VRAFVWAHGGNPNLIPEEEMRHIQIMFMDGKLGNTQEHLLLSQILSAMYGWMSGGKSRYPLKSFMGRTWDYLEPPNSMDEAQQANKGLAQEKAVIAMALAMGAKIPDHILKGTIH